MSSKVDLHVFSHVASSCSAFSHIVLWVDPGDIDRVAGEITAAMPAAYDEGKNKWIEPEHPIQRKLFNIIYHKNQHSCKDGPAGCRNQHNKCKRGFPCKVNSVETLYVDENRRYEYWRPRFEDRNVVPYHPTISFCCKPNFFLFLPNLFHFFSL
jgi:hypothetical protein